MALRRKSMKFAPPHCLRQFCHSHVRSSGVVQPLLSSLPAHRHRKRHPLIFSDYQRHGRLVVCLEKIGSVPVVPSSPPEFLLFASIASNRRLCCPHDHQRQAVVVLASYPDSAALFVRLQTTCNTSIYSAAFYTSCTVVSVMRLDMDS